MRVGFRFLNDLAAVAIALTLPLMLIDAFPWAEALEWLESGSIWLFVLDFIVI